MKYVLSILSILVLFSCHTPQYHYNKFIKKGGKIENKVDSIQVIKTINGEDSLVFVKIGCPEVKFPKSKTEIRQEQKTKRKEIKSEEKIELKKLQVEITRLKQENKTLRTKFRKEPKINKQNNKTKRTEVRQGRKKYNHFWIIVVAYIFGISSPTLFKLIRKTI